MKSNRIAFVFLVFFMLLGTNLLAQEKHFSLKGIISDTLGATLTGATVLLQNPSDSTLMDFTTTDDAGKFVFTSLARQDYLLKITYIGYLPKDIVIIAPSKENNTLDLGNIRISPIAQELMEIVIKEAKAPMSIRGDTIEYDASTFKVPVGSTVEDLLRRLPGMEVATDGSITSQGNSVSKVTVDGKSFFGGDPKAATKNLPAEGISKVSVFSTETEQSKLTGERPAGPPDKTMNLQLKEDFKKGGFGKATVGVGTLARAEAKGNYNKFDDKNQFSLVGNLNNTGRNGLSWDDYQEFRGASASTWYDGGDFGFGSSRRMTFISGGGDDGDEIGLNQGFFGSGSNNAGLPKNIGAGINYNYDNKKTKWSSVYFFSKSNLESNSIRRQENFLPENRYFRNETAESDRGNDNHRIELNFEQQIDSLNTLTISFNYNHLIRNELAESNMSLRRANEVLSTTAHFNNNLESAGNTFNSSAYYRKKFKKKGRAFGLNASYYQADNISDSEQRAINNFHDANGDIERTTNIFQNIDNETKRSIIKSNAMFVEPLGKRFFIQTFYNFNQRTDEGDRTVFDVNNASINDSLSRAYETQIVTNRLGSSLRYAYKGMNISLGLGVQRFDIQGFYETPTNTTPNGSVKQHYINWIPNFRFDTSPKRNQYLEASYSLAANEPSVRDLRPIIDNSNPLFIRLGNQDLVPELSHSISATYSGFNPARFTRFFMSLMFSYYKNQFTTDETVDEFFVTTTRPINYSGGKSVLMFSNYGFPIVKNRFTLNLGYSFSFGNTPAFVNSVKNNTQTVGHRPNLRVNITPNDQLNISASARFNFQTTTYDLNSSQNQNIRTQDYSLDLNAPLLWKYFASLRFSYNRYENERFGQAQEVPIINLSIYRAFLKDKMEIRLSGYDLLNRNLGISQNASATQVSELRTEVLGRYGMVSLTYNIRGVKSDTNNRRGGRRSGADVIHF